MTDLRNWMTVEDAADYLRCSERYLRELLANDAVPHVMFAGKALFHPPSLDAWLLTKQTTPETPPAGPRGDTPTMAEAGMARLIRDFPEEFFDEPLRLLSQDAASRSGIADLVFEDAQGDVVIVEVKRGILQREHAAQVSASMSDAQAQFKGRHVERVVVTNVVTPQRRAKLERMGVSVKEIPEARFHEVAQKHGISLAAVSGTEDSLSPADASGGSKAFRGDRVAVLPGCARQEAASIVAELINYGERFVSGLGRNLGADLERSEYAWISTKVYAQLSRWCHPNRNSEREQWVIPRVHRLSQCLFGRVIERTSHPSYVA